VKTTRPSVAKPQQNGLNPLNASECGAVHESCASGWKGTCGLPAGHGGPHLCGTCNAAF
jgi:hypothetical protein